MIESLGQGVLRFWAPQREFFGVLFGTVLATLRQAVTREIRYRVYRDQFYQTAVESAPVVILSLTFVSMMLITEFSFHMKLVLRQDSLVPAFSTLLMLRELGPVVTGLLLTSRVGAGMAAELASMKSTEQIDALRMLSLDPVDYLLPPRWLASVFASVTLTLISVGIGLMGGAMLAALSQGEALGEFTNSMFVFTRFSDLVGCIIKAAVFGTVIPIAAGYHGIRAREGSEGVGTAATSAVVHGSVLIIAADFVLTYLLYAI